MVILREDSKDAYIDRCQCLVCECRHRKSICSPLVLGSNIRWLADRKDCHGLGRYIFDRLGYLIHVPEHIMSRENLEYDAFSLLDASISLGD